MQHACGARVRVARRRCTSVHGSAGAFTRRRQPVRFVRTACMRTDGACVRVPAPDQVPKRGGIKKSWVGFPDFGSVAGKIRIGRDGDFFPDF